MVGALALLAYMLGRTVFSGAGTVLGRTMAFAVLSFHSWCIRLTRGVSIRFSPWAF